jgi:hypothetical protein
MNFYDHLQHIEAMRRDALRKYPERELREQLRAHRRQTPQLSLWRVLWAWFVARRQTANYDETVALMLHLLHQRKTKVVQNVQK